MRTTARHRILDALATGVYFGKMPFAPGTWGTIPGVLLLWLTGSCPLWGKAILLCLLFAIGVYVCNQARELYGSKDPSCVVIDEIAGVYLAGMLFTPTWPVLLATFLLFRFFDILKPWPIRRLEDLPAGWGVMMDDMAAGLFALLILLVGIHVTALYITGV